MKIIFQVFPPVGLAIHRITRFFKLLIRVIEYIRYESIDSIIVLILLTIALMRIVPNLCVLDV